MSYEKAADIAAYIGMGACGLILVAIIVEVIFCIVRGTS
jgi:hypothetical protein